MRDLAANFSVFLLCLLGVFKVQKAHGEREQPLGKFSAHEKNLKSFFLSNKTQILCHAKYFGVNFECKKDLPSFSEFTILPLTQTKCIEEGW